MVTAPVEDWKWWTGETAASSYFSHVLPMRGSVIDLLLSAHNRETGTGFTDRCLPALTCLAVHIEIHALILLRRPC